MLIKNLLSFTLGCKLIIKLISPSNILLSYASHSNSVTFKIVWKLTLANQSLTYCIFTAQTVQLQRLVKLWCEMSGSSSAAASTILALLPTVCHWLKKKEKVSATSLSLNHYIVWVHAWGKRHSEDLQPSDHPLPGCSPPSSSKRGVLASRKSGALLQTDSIWLLAVVPPPLRRAHSQISASSLHLSAWDRPN